MIILSSEKVDYDLSDNYNRGQVRPAINPEISGLSCHGYLQMWRTRSVKLVLKGSRMRVTEGKL